MAHSKVFMLQVMAEKRNEIVSTMLEEGINIKEDILNIPEGAESLRADFIRPAYHWIVDVHAREFYNVREVKKLLAPEIWTRYRTWGGFEDHREVVMLREAMSDLRQRIVSRDRPDFFKKTVIQKKMKHEAKLAETKN